MCHHWTTNRDKYAKKHAKFSSSPHSNSITHPIKSKNCCDDCEKKTGSVIVSSGCKTYWNAGIIFLEKLLGVGLIWLLHFRSYHRYCALWPSPSLTSPLLPTADNRPPDLELKVRQCQPKLWEQCLWLICSKIFSLFVYNTAQYVVGLLLRLAQNCKLLWRIYGNAVSEKFFLNKKVWMLVVELGFCIITVTNNFAQFCSCLTLISRCFTV